MTKNNKNLDGKPIPEEHLLGLVLPDISRNVAV